jgi:hypothetical protein
MPRKLKPTHSGEEYRFKIDAYSPTKIPMARLAEYMLPLAQMLGETGQVHFHRLAPGSTVLVSRVEHEAVPKVLARVSQVKRGEGTVEVLRAYSAINKLLRDDNAVGVLRTGSAIVLPFPGRNEAQEEFESVRQQGFVDGVVTGVRGRDETRHITLETADGQQSGFSTTRAIAKELARKYDEHVRLFGRGKWNRDKEGVWTLQEFKVEGFEELDDAPLSDVLAKLRSIATEWGDAAYEELSVIRHGTRGNGNGGRR